MSNMEYFNVKILAKFFAKERVDGDSDLDQLLFLDDLWRDVYQRNKHRSFAEGTVMANEFIISHLFPPCSQPDEGANEDFAIWLVARWFYHPTHCLWYKKNDHEQMKSDGKTYPQVTEIFKHQTGR